MVEKKWLSGGVCAGHDGRSSRPREKKQKVRRTKLQPMVRFSPRTVDRIARRDRGFNRYKGEEPAGRTGAKVATDGASHGFPRGFRKVGTANADVTVTVTVTVSS